MLLKYFEDLAVLSSALRSGHAFVPTLVNNANRMMTAVKRLLQSANSVLAGGDQAELLVALRQLSKAFGEVQAIADKAHLNSTQLHRTLSPDANPALSSFRAILDAMGMRLTVEPKATA